MQTTVVSQIQFVLRKHLTQMHLGMESDGFGVCRRERRGMQNLAVIPEADEAKIESRVYIWSEQKAVEGVKALAVVCFTPRLDMGCLEDGGDITRGCGAPGAPQFL